MSFYENIYRRPAQGIEHEIPNCSNMIQEIQTFFVFIDPSARVTKETLIRAHVLTRAQNALLNPPLRPPNRSPWTSQRALRLAIARPFEISLLGGSSSHGGACGRRGLSSRACHVHAVERDLIFALVFIRRGRGILEGEEALPY